MSNPNVTAAVATITAIGTALRGIPLSGEAGAGLNWAISDMVSSAASLVVTKQIGTTLSTLFAMATNAGAALDDMASVRTYITATTAAGTIAPAIKVASIRLCLAQEAQILSGTTLESRQDVERYIARFNQAFDDAETVAADTLDIESYQAVVALHGAVIRDLTTRAWTLPNIVAYSFNERLPSVVIANRFYADANRQEELAADNKPVHPLFMPTTGRAFSQ